MEMKCLERKWVVLFAAFFANFCSVGLIFNMSVLYVEWLEAFEESAAKTALVQSICTGMFALSGVILGMLLSRFGVRIIGIGSGILHALGFILSFFAPNLIYLILVLSVSAGLKLDEVARCTLAYEIGEQQFMSKICYVYFLITCLGVGSSGIYLASMTIVQQYFDGKQKHASLSIASFGSGVGGTVFTYALNYFSLQYGWRGCTLIVGGILLHSVPLFALCRPLNEANSINTSTKSSTQVDGGNTADHMHQLTKLLRNFKQIIRTKLFLINLVGVIILQAIAAPMIILIDYLEEKGFSREEAVLSYMVFSICASVSRLVPAVLKCIPHVSIFGIALLISVLGTATFLALPSVHSFSWNIVTMCCMGLCYGAVVGGMLPVSAAKTVSRQHFSQALGITLTGFGIVLLIAGPFSGFLRDTTGSYDAVCYVTGSSECLSVLMFSIALGLNRKLNNQRITTNSDDRKQFDDEKSSAKAYDNLSFETYL